MMCFALGRREKVGERCDGGFQQLTRVEVEVEKEWPVLAFRPSWKVHYRGIQRSVPGIWDEACGM